MDTTGFNIDYISTFGVPMIILAFIAFSFLKYFPQFINVYKESKAKETEVINKMQENFANNTEKIIETAAVSAKALDQNTQAWADNKALLKTVVEAVKAVEISIKQLNKTVEGQVTEVKAMKAILENESGDK